MGLLESTEGVRFRVLRPFDLLENISQFPCIHSAGLGRRDSLLPEGFVAQFHAELWCCCRLISANRAAAYVVASSHVLADSGEV